MAAKISIIMGVYNCADTLREAIDSILAQTYTDWQFVICDDCSSDNSYDILREYAAKDSRFVVLRNEKNSKLSFTLNHCLQYANGEFVARMDGDDISVPDRLEKQLAFLQSHPEYELVGTAMRQFNEGGMIRDITKPESPNKNCMRSIVPFNHATIMTYKRVYNTLGGYTVSERTVRAQDYDLWFRFFAAGFRGYNLSEPLYHVREDLNAIKRRTFKVRWNAYKTTRIGFKMLGFPKIWLVGKFLSMIGKSLVPYRVILWYRKCQSKTV